MLVKKHRINIAFISSLQSAQYFRQLNLKDFASHWIPEAITVSNYRYKPYRERTIDVIQLGRRWDAYHEKIQPFCQSQGIVYLYEKKNGDLIFSTREEYLQGLSNSKISICVPRSVTHPASAGGIATMTRRYLESMASRCLILGVLPAEMEQLFDYNPIIEIDFADPCEQLRALLRDFESYLDLIEKNYEYVTTNHQWTNRLQKMNEYIAEFSRERVASAG